MIHAEQSHGGTIIGSRNEAVSKFGKISVTELSANIFDVDAKVTIACRSEGKVHGIWYSSEVHDSSEQSQRYEQFALPLSVIFGPPVVTDGTNGRVARFLCGRIATVILFENSDINPSSDREVSLLVDPSPGPC